MNSSPLSTSKIFLRVAIPTPLRNLSDYVLPSAALKFTPTVGARVLVPFGKRTVIAIIIEINNSTELQESKLKAIIDVLDKEALFTPKLRELLLWASNYYQYPLGLLYETAMPSFLCKAKELNIAALLTPKKITLTPQHELNLNADQQHAITQVQNSFGEFKAFLLDGVTGSGKTEVYMQLIAATIAQQKQALILIPEINLTPQTLARFQQRFAVPIAVLHSQVSAKNRVANWLQAKEGVAPIVLGTRLAAFTPLKNPGLFIIDEEHDLSFKQQDHFRYSARDLLLKRAQLENCPIVLGTATPALETWQNAAIGRYQRLELPQRAGAANKPIIEIIDVRHKQLDEGISNDLLQQIREHLAAQGQVLLFLNRRGFAPVLMCFNCGWHQACKRCDSNMILHYHTQVLRCHHCEATCKIPKVCPTCNDINIGGVGLGTQRIEQALTQHFPNARIARVDRDTVHTKAQLQTMFDAVHDGSINILIGTQMLAKGHHFPNLSLVAIVDIDSALFSADFRATERIGQLITQVAGRAGRGTKLCKVVLQTTHPDHPLLNALIYRSYHDFLEILLQERKAARLPPFSHQVLLRAETKNPNSANAFLKIVKNMAQINPQQINSFGPIAAPMEKRQGFFRSQLLFQADTRSALQNLLSSITPQIAALPDARKVRWSIDVDPLDMF